MRVALSPPGLPPARRAVLLGLALLSGLPYNALNSFVAFPHSIKRVNPMLPTSISPKLADVIEESKRLTHTERLLLARVLLDSILSDEVLEDIDWNEMGLASFQKDWDNDEDAIYDNWRAYYGVEEG